MVLGGVGAGQGLAAAGPRAYCSRVAEPAVVLEDLDFVAVVKPAGLHTAPLRAGETGTLLEWVLARFPEVVRVPGLKPVEPGLLHRLDQDTSGLVLVARTLAGWEALQAAGREGRFVKRYRALAAPATRPPEGTRELLMAPVDPAAATLPVSVVSAFRAWGPGRRRVAAIAPGQAAGRRLYTTRLLAIEAAGPSLRVLAELASGFRHQVRVHLASVGLPIVGDRLYGPPEAPAAARLFLHACGLEFPHPRSGRQVVVSHEEL